MIESDSGLYVGKLVSLLDREATDQKKKSIVEERKQEQYEKLLETWRKDTKIEENEKIWNKIDFEKLGVSIKQSEEQYDDTSTAK